MTDDMTPTSPIELAVAMGRLEEGQKHVLDAVNEMRQELRLNGATVTVVQSENAVLKSQVQDLQAWRTTLDNDGRTRRPTILNIVAIIIGVASILASVTIGIIALVT